MSSNHNEQTTVRQYLLGQLAGSSRDEFEERFFTDDELVDELLATEDELIEASIAGELSVDEAEWFAKYFLITPERQQKLCFRKALKRVAKTGKHQQLHSLEHFPTTSPWHAPRWAHWATLSVAALAIIGGIISMARYYQGNFVELALTARSNERSVGSVVPRIKLPLQYNRVKLHLTLDQPLVSAKDYRVEMLTDDGKTRTLMPVSHNGQAVDVVLHASELARGRYAFNVYGIKSDGTEQRIPGSYLLLVE